MYTLAQMLFGLAFLRYMCTMLACMSCLLAARHLVLILTSTGWAAALWEDLGGADLGNLPADVTASQTRLRALYDSAH